MGMAESLLNQNFLPRNTWGPAVLFHIEWTPDFSSNYGGGVIPVTHGYTAGHRGAAVGDCSRLP